MTEQERLEAERIAKEQEAIEAERIAKEEEEKQKKIASDTMIATTLETIAKQMAEMAEQNKLYAEEIENLKKAKGVVGKVENPQDDTKRALDTILKAKFEDRRQELMTYFDLKEEEVAEYSDLEKLEEAFRHFKKIEPKIKSKYLSEEEITKALMGRKKMIASIDDKIGDEQTFKANQEKKTSSFFQAMNRFKN
ncbi:MAG: hypothetical protein ACRC6E_08285 [Fusobacteriaceae bacterium]